MADESVEWRIDAANSRAIRLVMYGWHGLFGGGFILLGGFILFIGVSAALAGNLAVAALIGVFVLVGGPFSVLYLYPAIRSGSFTPLSQFIYDPAPDPAEPLGTRYAAVFSWHHAGIAIGLHLLILPVAFWLDPRLLWGYVAIWFGLLFTTSLLSTWGRINPTDPLFEYRSTTIPLGAIAQVRRCQIGHLIVCWLSYQRGAASITTPSWIVFTPEAAAAFEAALARAESRSAAGDASRPIERLVAGGIGAGCLAIGGWIWFVVETDPGYGVYAGVVFGLIGVFFLWLGYTGV